MQRAGERRVAHVSQDEVRLKEGAHIGHGAMIYLRTIGVQAMVGMNVLDHAEIGDGCIVGALCWSKHGPREGRTIVGNPAQKVGDVDEVAQGEGTALYQQLRRTCSSTRRKYPPWTQIRAIALRISRRRWQQRRRKHLDCGQIRQEKGDLQAI